MREPSPRMRKVNSTLRQVLAEEVERLSDARLDLVSVTGVDTAPNLRHAIVYVDVLGEDRHQPALDALNRASKRLQAAIGREVRIKYTPTLEWKIDPGVVAGERIENLLRSLQRSAGEEE